jgi:hypothetical protein
MQVGSGRKQGSEKGVGRPVGRPTVGRPTVGRLTVGRPTVGRPTVGRPLSLRGDLPWVGSGRGPRGAPVRGRPPVGRPTVGRPTVGRPPVGRPTVGRPTVGRPLSLRCDLPWVGSGRGPRGAHRTWWWTCRRGAQGISPQGGLSPQGTDPCRKLSHANVLEVQRVANRSNLRILQ